MGDLNRKILMGRPYEYEYPYEYSYNIWES